MGNGTDPRRTVLYVEDNPADARLVREHLRGFAWADLVLAGSRDEALRSVEERVPELVLLDLSLPGGNGMHFIRDLRHSERTRYIPVVVFSGSNRPSDVQLCLSAGASAFVRKPAEPEAYRRALETAVAFWCQVAEPPPNGG
ncbi:MAG TPA: response regulator [Candidatus Polarisedimenticolaceae bacterium]|nr:response regulator [Candidatus Polarisedimenticolaceae bacterium]